MNAGPGPSRPFVVRGGSLVLPDRVTTRDLVIRGGRIVDLVAPDAWSDLGAGVDVVDADGLLVFPGAVDPHVHFDEPGRTSWEGFDTGSAAASTRSTPAGAGSTDPAGTATCAAYPPPASSAQTSSPTRHPLTPSPSAAIRPLHSKPRYAGAPGGGG